MPSPTKTDTASSLKPVIQKVHQAILDNRLFTTDLPADVEAMAAEIVRSLVLVEPESFPRLVQRSGLFFIVEEGAATEPVGADVLHVNVWLGSSWATVDTIVLPTVAADSAGQ